MKKRGYTCGNDKGVAKNFTMGKIQKKKRRNRECVLGTGVFLGEKGDAKCEKKWVKFLGPTRRAKCGTAEHKTGGTGHNPKGPLKSGEKGRIGVKGVCKKRWFQSK